MFWHSSENHSIMNKMLSYILLSQASGNEEGSINNYHSVQSAIRCSITRVSLLRIHDSFSWHLQTPKKELKMQCTGEYFSWTPRCLEMWGNTFWSVWYAYNNEDNIYPSTISVMISFCLNLMKFNEFDNTSLSFPAKQSWTYCPLQKAIFEYSDFLTGTFFFVLN